MDVEVARPAAGRSPRSGGQDPQDLLRVALNGEDVPGHLLRLHHQLAEMTGNRLVILFDKVLHDLVPHQVNGSERTDQAMAALAEVVQRAYVRIVEAVVAGDADQAGRRMAGHLDVARDVLR